MNEELRELRKSIDNLDNALVAILVERFRLTEKVGIFKADKDLPAIDEDREKSQKLTFKRLADYYGMNDGIVIEIMDVIIKIVRKRHDEIKSLNSKLD